MIVTMDCEFDYVNSILNKPLTNKPELPSTPKTNELQRQLQPDTEATEELPDVRGGEVPR
jgi:hypothetical protein